MRHRRARPRGGDPGAPRVRAKLSEACRIWPDSMHGRAIGASRAPSPRTTTIAYIARETGVSTPTVSKVINGRADVVRDPEPGRGDDPPARLRPAVRRSRRAPVIDSSSTSSRASGRSRWSAAWSGRRSEPTGRRPHRDAGAAWPGPGLDRGGPRAAADGRDRRVRPRPGDAQPLQARGIPSSSSTRRGAAARHAIDRGDELEDMNG